MRLLFLLLAIVSLSAGISPSKGSRSTAITRIWEIGDLHYGTALGGQQNGAKRLRKMMYLSNSRHVDAWIVDGDWTFNQDGSEADTVIWLLRDSLQAECFPGVGNHEWAAADTATGNIYNHFTNQWPDFFRPYVDATHRGSRWYGRRVGNSNCVVVAIQNSRDTTGTANYPENNNPTGGVFAYDFDGISDSTSAQRVDVAQYIRTLGPRDVVFFMQHRCIYPMATISTRPQQEDAWTNVNKSQIMWADQNIRRTWILIEADIHQNAGFSTPHRNHYAFSACMVPRAKNRTAIATWSSRIRWLALSDTTISGGSLDDSLGVTSATQPATSWNTVIEFEIQGTKITARCWLIQYGSNLINPSAAVDSVVWYQ